MIAKLKKTRLLFVQSVFPASTLRRLRGLTLHVDGRAEELCSATPACSGCQGEAGRRQGSLISCWHLSYVFVYQEQGSTTGERQILSREWLSWSLVLSVSREGGGEEVCCCIIQILYLHIQYSKGFRANTHTEGNRHTHTLKIHDWEAKFGYFRDGLFISHYQVMSGNFISNQSAAMIYLFRLSW